MSPQHPADSPAARREQIREQILDAELPHVVERRRQVEPCLLDPLQDADAAKEAARGSLIGLALSGGGLRSACFNLGVIQAFFRSGLLRHVDYLATVSGGGYVGSFLSSCLLAEGVRMRRQDATLARELPANEHGAHPQRIGEFLLNGKYLFRPTTLANHYLARLVLWNLVLFSGLVCLCALVAFLWRWLDWPLVADGMLVSSGGWVRELTRPFVPAVLLFVLWFVAWLVSAASRGRHSRARVANVLLVLAVGSLLVGFAVLLATPNISVVPPHSPGASQGVESFSWTEPQRWIFLSISAAISAALLPFLKPQQLLQAMTAPKKPYWMRWVVNAASLALLLGIPFLLVCVLAKHDLCFWQPSTTRTALHHSDIDLRRWESFWNQVGQEAAETPAGPSGLIWKAATTDDRGQEDPEVLKLLSDPKLDCPGEAACATMTDDERARLHESLTASTRPLDERAWRLKQCIVGRLNRKVIGGPPDEAALGPPVTTWFGFLLPAAEPCPEAEAETAATADLFTASAARHLRGEKPANVAAHTAVPVAKSTRAVYKEVVTQNAAPAAPTPPAAPAPEVKSLLEMVDSKGLKPEEKADLNRRLLEAVYPHDLVKRTSIRRAVVIERDQVVRLIVILASGACFVLFALIIPLNFTSMHGFYRDRLAGAFIEPTEPGRTRQIPLTDLRTTARGGPYHLLLATANWFPTIRSLWHGPEQRPPEGTEGFLFSQTLCGSAGSGYLPTEKYHSDHLTLDEAMTLSGAAFNPARVTNPLLFCLMVVLNFRLGQWLPSPARNRRPWGAAWGRVFDLFRRDGEAHARFITDGGHHDNLGLWPLLQRRCKLIVLSDASADPQFAFAELARVLRRGRVEENVRFTCCQTGQEALPLQLLRPVKYEPPKPVPQPPPVPPFLSPTSPRHYLIFRVLYPDGTEGHLVYLRASLTGDEPTEVQCHALTHDEFPHDPIGNQLFEPEQVESYRQVGEHIGEQLGRELTGPDARDDALWQGPFPWEALDAWCRRARTPAEPPTPEPPRTP